MAHQIVINSKTIDILAILMLMSTIMLVGMSRLKNCIWAYAFRSFILAWVSGLIAYFSGIHHIYITTGISLVLKVIIIPGFLFYIINKVKIKNEVESFISYTLSLLISCGIILIAYYSTQSILKFENVFMRHCLPVSLAITLVGFFVMITRKKAITQILGLLAMEDGLFFAALSTSYGMPLIVELGIFFDILVGVIIMGIYVYRIKETFDTIDTDFLRELRE
ncbi:MAG: Hydrogenase-4 membrane subunit HyfE [Candidatus Jettenia ecosi]|uniref:Hydrogenase-4 membrane subunit HyfE n=1 Tax=Candidatus Jettenia ecosi TaxID=2494326 RepID=A0A533QDI0_9BACT|nr:MAG: Hydrogenase-4 membrane subunit HyfE [Candidatus Jettenia ecosi]